MQFSFSGIFVLDITITENHAWMDPVCQEIVKRISESGAGVVKNNLL